VRDDSHRVIRGGMEIIRRSFSISYVLPPAIKLDRFCLRSGVYFLCLGDVVVYVGSSSRVSIRVASHKTKGIISFDRSYYIPCDKEDMLDLERAMIRKFVPDFNIGIQIGTTSEAANLEELDWRICARYCIKYGERRHSLYCSGDVSATGD
jgi:hypothetical protein